jgi:16S rRNA U516 pseudouridylate synthase RsuA-like enzyme
MCEALGHQVNRLVRIGYAFLTLDDLAPGQKRMLTAQEIARLKRLGKRSLNPGKRPANRK